jgi:hypothetical protein
MRDLAATRAAATGVIPYTAFREDQSGGKLGVRAGSGSASTLNVEGIKSGLAEPTVRIRLG